MDTKIVVRTGCAIEIHFSSFPPIQLFSRNIGINFPCLFAEGQKQTPFINQKLCLDSRVPTTPCTNTYLPRMCLHSIIEKLLLYETSGAPVHAIQTSAQIRTNIKAESSFLEPSPVRA